MSKEGKIYQIVTQLVGGLSGSCELTLYAFTPHISKHYFNFFHYYSIIINFTINVNIKVIIIIINIISIIIIISLFFIIIIIIFHNADTVITLPTQ